MSQKINGNILAPVLLCCLMPALAMRDLRKPCHGPRFSWSEHCRRTIFPPASPSQLTKRGTARLYTLEAALVLHQTNEWRRLFLQHLQQLHAAHVYEHPSSDLAQLTPYETAPSIPRYANEELTRIREALMLGSSGCQLSLAKKHGRAISHLQWACYDMPDNNALHMGHALAHHAAGQKEIAHTIYERHLRETPPGTREQDA